MIHPKLAQRASCNLARRGRKFLWPNGPACASCWPLHPDYAAASTKMSSARRRQPATLQKTVCTHEVATAAALCSALNTVDPSAARTAGQATGFLEDALSTLMLGRLHRLSGVTCSIPRDGIMFAVAHQRHAKGPGPHMYIAIRCYVSLPELQAVVLQAMRRAEDWLGKCPAIHPGMCACPLRCSMLRTATKFP